MTIVTVTTLSCDTPWCWRHVAIDPTAPLPKGWLDAQEDSGCHRCPVCANDHNQTNVDNVPDEPA